VQPTECRSEAGFLLYVSLSLSLSLLLSLSVSLSLFFFFFFSPSLPRPLSLSIYLSESLSLSLSLLITLSLSLRQIILAPAAWGSQSKPSGGFCRRDYPIARAAGAVAARIAIMSVVLLLIGMYCNVLYAVVMVRD
jgi:hypothetical protein